MIVDFGRGNSNFIFGSLDRGISFFINFFRYIFKGLVGFQPVSQDCFFLFVVNGRLANLVNSAGRFFLNRVSRCFRKFFNIFI
jgi:hypothetical protein